MFYILADGLTLEYEWQQVSRTLLSLLVNLKNAEFLMLLICLPIFNYSCPLTKPLGNVPSTQIIIGITVTPRFHNFVSFFIKVQVLVSLIFWFSICDLPSGQSLQYDRFFFFFFFLLIITLTLRLWSLEWPNYEQSYLDWLKNIFSYIIYLNYFISISWK